MQVTGVGSGNSYNYDIQTKRLSSVNGTADDAFVRYFNDDTDGTDSSTLNGYDRRTKGVIKNAIDRIQEFYEAGLMDKPLAQDGDSTITVSYEIEDSTTTSVSVNGEKRLTMVAPMLYLPDELSLLSTDAPEFKTKTMSSQFINRSKTLNDAKQLKEVQSSSYKIAPRLNEPYVDIYDSDGNKLGVFSISDLNIKIDSDTRSEILLSSHGTAAYDAIPMTEELKADLCEVLGTDYLESEDLKGYSIKTHSETGIQYVLRNGEEGRGGRVLIRNESDQQRFDALTEKCMKKYPNLISGTNAAAIYAELEIRGLAKSTENGIVTMGWNGASYIDNNDSKKNWAVEYTEDVFKRIDEWIKKHREFMDSIDQMNAWNDMFKILGVNYDRIWSDEESKQGFLNQQ